MPPARSLTPPVALDYVHELSADVRAGVVLDAEGELSSAITFAVEDGRITRIFVIRNPDKLGRVGEVAELSR